MTKKIRTVIISPPWISYIFPSLAAGTLAAFAGKHGYHVEARNLHLDVADLFSGISLQNIAGAAFLIDQGWQCVINSNIYGDMKSYRDAS